MSSLATRVKRKQVTAEPEMTGDGEPGVSIADNGVVYFRPLLRPMENIGQKICELTSDISPQKLPAETRVAYAGTRDAAPRGQTFLALSNLNPSFHASPVDPVRPSSGQSLDEPGGLRSNPAG